MREKRPAIPTTAQKRGAAESFHEWDPDAENSTTDSESETERLERYPAKRRPSPRKTSSRLQEQLKDVRPRAPGKKAPKAEKDEARNLAVRTRQSTRQSAVAEKRKVTKLEPMPRNLREADGVEDEDATPGSGQVFLDDDDQRRAWDVAMRARRAVMHQTETDLDPSKNHTSDIGLFALLPGELRNRIYRLALVEGDDDPFTVHMEPLTCNMGACLHMRMQTAVPGILSASKQLRTEAMPIFVAENSFKFDSEIVKARCVANWVRVIGPYAELLSKVVLDIVCWEVPVSLRMVSHEKVGVHYEMTLRWKTNPVGRWSLHTDREIAAKATSELSVLDEYVNMLNREIVGKGKAKEDALREFVWSDWLAKLIWICKK